MQPNNVLLYEGTFFRLVWLESHILAAVIEKPFMHSDNTPTRQQALGIGMLYARLEPVVLFYILFTEKKKRISKRSIIWSRPTSTLVRLLISYTPFPTNNLILSNTLPGSVRTRIQKTGQHTSLNTAAKRT